MQVRVHSCSLTPPSTQGEIVCSISCLDRSVQSLQKQLCIIEYAPVRVGSSH